MSERDSSTESKPKQFRRQFASMRVVKYIWMCAKGLYGAITACLMCFVNLILKALHFFRAENRLVAIFLLALAPALVIFDPFRWDEVSDLNQARFIDKLFSPYYGKKERRGQDLITVVLINQQSLIHSGDPQWPPSYRYQAKLLEALSVYEPMAIFMDFYYAFPQTPPRTEEEIKQEQRALQLSMLQSIPSKSNSVDIADRLRRSECQPLGSANRIDENESSVFRLALTIDCIRRGRLILPSAIPGGVKTIEKGIPILTGSVSTSHQALELLDIATRPTVDRTPGQVGIRVVLDDNINYPTFTNNILNAAFALHQIYCRRTHEESRCEHNIHEFFDDQRPLNITWGYGYLSEEDSANSASANSKNAQPNEPQGKTLKPVEYVNPCVLSADDRLKTALGFFRDELFFGVTKPDARGCHYHHAIPAHDIIASPAYNNGDPLPKETFAPFEQSIDAGMRRYLKDKIVLIGADLPSLADGFDTPIYEKQPGVFLHAMALDNLITIGTKAAKEPGYDIGGADAADLFALLLTFMAQIFILTVHIRFSSAENGEAKRLGAYISIIILSALIIVFNGFFIMNWPATNVLDSVSILLLSIVIIEGDAAWRRPSRGEVNEQ